MNRNVNRALSFGALMLMMGCGFAAETEIRLIPGVPLLFVDDTVLKERRGLVLYSVEVE